MSSSQKKEIDKDLYRDLTRSVQKDLRRELRIENDFVTAAVSQIIVNHLKEILEEK